MPIPSIYLNLEDDVNKIIQRIKRERAESVVLVCPKRCFLFSDSINLRLLKKQTDLLGKEVFILTMDELGQMYAKEVGFKLKFLPKPSAHGGMGDIRRAEVEKPKPAPIEPVEQAPSLVESTVKTIKQLVHKPTPKVEAPKVLPKVKVTDSIFPEIQEQKNLDDSKKRSRKLRKWSLSFVVLCILLVVVLLFGILPKATVAVYPKTDPLTRDWDVNISTQTQSPDATNLNLPATAVDQTLEENNKFTSQGKQQIGNKATGTVQIYNFTGQPLNLKAGTTLLTLGSNNYVLTRDLSGIRPTTYINATTKEVNSGSLTSPVDVIAQNGGEDYNVAAGTRLEISNQVFGSRPQMLFAKTVTAITGGTTRFLSLITDSDMTAAQNSLADKALADARAQLDNKGLVLADKSYTASNLGFAPDQAVGTQSPNFNANLKIKITGLAFSIGDLKQLVSDRINQTLAAGETLNIPDPQKQIVYNIKSIDLKAGTAVLGVHFEGNAVMNVNVNDVASDLVGKSLSEANDLLLSKTSIDKVEITLAPTWQKKFPLFASKIKVVVSH